MNANYLYLINKTMEVVSFPKITNENKKKNLLIRCLNFQPITFNNPIIILIHSYIYKNISPSL